MNAARRILAAEALGTGLLVLAVVGSGIMGARLTDDVALALLANTVATGAALFVLITVLGPVSGAHFNPFVTLCLRADTRWSHRFCLAVVVCQFAGGLAGTVLAHAMFALPLVQVSAAVRTGLAQALAEFVATFGLVLVIFGALRAPSANVAGVVAAYIMAAYWFTASTSFANPAVTVARAFTDTFAGIRPADVPAFLVGQALGAGLGLVVAKALFPSSRRAMNEKTPGLTDGG